MACVGLWRTGGHRRETGPEIATPEAMNRKLLMAAAIALCACSTNSIDPVGGGSLPSRISECETNTARVCGTWSRNAGTNTYAAVWSQNSTAIITVERWDDDLIEFTRRDTGGPTPTMVARYVGIPSANTVTKGQVRWTNNGLTIFGTWDASW